MARSSSKRRKRSIDEAGADDGHPPSTAAAAAIKTAAAVRKSAVAAERTAVLTHGTADKRDGLRLKLHLERAKRSLVEQRDRLERWDAAAEKQAEEEEERLKNEQEPEPPKLKNLTCRPSDDPSTWKLKGAARPAAEVYDFDVRYVDKYVNDHTSAQEKAKRQVNRLAQGDLAGFAVGRKFLALLMQIGHLSAEAKLYRQAREAWLECMKLEGSPPVTTARECLMQLCLRRRKFQEAYELGTAADGSSEDNDSSTRSAVVCYSTALAAFVLQKGIIVGVEPNDDNKTKNKKSKKESSSSVEQPAAISEQDVNDQMEKAIRNNVFLAYYIIHYETFKDVMECQDELEQARDDDDDDADDEAPQSLLEEAIEYVHSSDQIAVWRELGAQEALARVLQSMPGGVDWEGPLDRLVQMHQQQQQQQQQPEQQQPEQQQSPSSSKVDLTMFAGMFRTAMEMVRQQR
jgi:hypothetical protein